jgi:hypothetical protein
LDLGILGTYYKIYSDDLVETETQAEITKAVGNLASENNR